MTENDKVARLVNAVRELVESITHDDCGTLIGDKWMGGNGGMLSRETIQKADAVRRALAAMGNG